MPHLHYEVVHTAAQSFGREFLVPKRTFGSCGEKAENLRQAYEKMSSAEDYILAVENGKPRQLSDDEEAQLSRIRQSSDAA